jgi:glucans biosynthesis protein
MTNRRTFLVSATASSTLTALGLPLSAAAASAPLAAPLSAPAGLRFGNPQPFSYDTLIAHARVLSRRPYTAPAAPPADVLAGINYEAHGKIQFRSDMALFADGPGQFPVTFVHLGAFSRAPVRMFVIEPAKKGPVSREVVYDESYFDMPADSPARRVARGSGFAGFRLQESRLGDQKKLPWKTNDWAAFQGASYFRAIGELYQYGLSARGIAIDVGEPGKPEEFPNFTHFYFEAPDDRKETMTVYALLDGPSIAGAYRFSMQRGKGVVMDVDCALFLRKDVARLGIAPLTSMYWFSDSLKVAGSDWRPEVHDSDGLAIWNGAGERIWRPLNNPPRTTTSSFSDENPRGYGLLQRDRNFDHYQDGVHYERRPSLWVEPRDNWDGGAVQLVEIPTDDEIHDNIVAMWVPKGPIKAGSDVRVRYRLHWLADEPFGSPLARSVATRLGNGGQPGQPRPQGVRKFVVEFRGAPLDKLPSGTRPEAVLSTSRGTFANVFTEAVPNGVAGHWRAQFDLAVDGKDPVDLRLFLRLDGKALSETWLYQYHPFRRQPIYAG